MHEMRDVDIATFRIRRSYLENNVHANKDQNELECFSVNIYILLIEGLGL